jgi:hypothetical protein
MNISVNSASPRISANFFELRNECCSYLTPQAARNVKIALKHTTLKRFFLKSADCNTSINWITMIMYNKLPLCCPNPDSAWIFKNSPVWSSQTQLGCICQLLLCNWNWCCDFFPPPKISVPGGTKWGIKFGLQRLTIRWDPWKSLCITMSTFIIGEERENSSSSSYSTMALSVWPCLPLWLTPIPLYPMPSFSIVSHQASLNHLPRCLSTWVWEERENNEQNSWSSSSSSSSFCGLPVANAPDVLQPSGLLYYP